MPYNPMSGPIPGENFTSDTKNYPWHRPPEHNDLDEAIDAAADKILSKEGSLGVLTMLKNGIPAVTLANIFITSGVGAGKWTPDFGLLMAGPVTHIIYLLGKGYGIEVELGVDNKLSGGTSAIFEGMKRLSQKSTESIRSTVDSMIPEIQANAARQGGFAGGPPEEEAETPGGMMGGPEVQSDEETYEAEDQ